MNEVIIMSVVFLLGVWLVGSVAWDIFRTLLDIKFELEDMNRELKSRKDRPWNYTMKELEAGNQARIKMTKPFRNIYETKEVWSKARERQRRDAFAWKVGVFAMTIISIVGCYAIYWALTL